jgi:hypothetical protein
MNANHCVETFLNDMAYKLGELFEPKSNVIAIVGAILGNLATKVRDAIESIPADQKKPDVIVVLDTGGGVVEIIERIVTCLRHHFQSVHFVIPDHAMSAGTVFAMSGDSIWMDYFSTLGPIDPQIEKDGQLIPASAYVAQYDDLVKKSLEGGKLSAPEIVLLGKLDLAELDYYRQASNLSKNLLTDWLSRYKFKDWIETESKKEPVKDEKKKNRAEEIANKLGDHRFWKSHGRPIGMSVLKNELNLRIDDLSSRPEFRNLVRLYLNLVIDYTTKTGVYQAVHTVNRLL